MSYLATKVAYITIKIDQAQRSIAYYKKQVDDMIGMGLKQIQDLQDEIAEKQQGILAKYERFDKSNQLVQAMLSRDLTILFSLRDELLDELEAEIDAYIDEGVGFLFEAANKEIGQIDGVPVKIGKSGSGRNSMLSFDIDVPKILAMPMDTVTQMQQVQQDLFSAAVSPVPAPMPGSAVAAAVQASLKS